MTPIRWFMSYLKKYRWYMISGLCLVVVTTMLALINPYISGQIVDDVIQGGAFDLLPKLIFVLIGVTVLRSALRFTFLMFFETSSQGVLYSLREAVYKKFMKEDFDFYNIIAQAI